MIDHSMSLKYFQGYLTNLCGTSVHVLQSDRLTARMNVRSQTKELHLSPILISDWECFRHAPRAFHR